MLWVFVGLLVVIGAIMVAALQQVMNSVTSKRYIPPSDAFIDQVLPQEILEQIFSFTDPLTFQRCHNVSKYWRSHTSKKQIKEMVIERYVNRVRSSAFARRMSEVYTNVNSAKYPANYSLDTRLRDMALAEKKGKLLLEQIPATDGFVMRKGLSDPEKSLFIIKTMAKLVNTTPRFRMGEVRLNAIDKSVAPLLSIDESGVARKDVQYEVMLNLEDYYNVDLQEARFIMVRNLTEKKNRFGFIMVDDDFLRALAFLFIPLIVHDVLQSEPFMNLLKFWAGPITCIALCFLILRDDLESLDTYEGTKKARLFKILVILTAAAVIIGSIVFYSLSTSIWAFNGMVLAISIYVWVLHDYVFGDSTFQENNSQNYWQKFRTLERRPLMFVCAALVLLMNDWSMTIRSFTDGTLWYRLLWNTGYYMSMPLFAIWNNAMICMLEDRDHVFQWKYFIDWDGSLIMQFVYFYGAVVFLTLYAPYWQGNH